MTNLHHRLQPGPLRPGPGDNPHSLPTPPDSSTPISRPTTPPQAFHQSPSAPHPPTSTLPNPEAEELRQLRLQFQQQVVHHQLQHQVLLQSPYGPSSHLSTFISHNRLLLPCPFPHLHPRPPPTLACPPRHPTLPTSPTPRQNPHTTDQTQSTPTNRSSRRADRPVTPTWSIRWKSRTTSPTRLEHSGNLVYLMGDIVQRSASVPVPNTFGLHLVGSIFALRDLLTYGWIFTHMEPHRRRGKRDRRTSRRSRSPRRKSTG